jgi:hypothetical protein
MPNYLERIFAAGARTAPEKKPGMPAPPRIPGVMLPSGLHLDQERSPEQPAVTRSGPIATSLPSGAPDLFRHETPPIPRRATNPGRTASSQPEPMPRLKSLAINAPRMRIAGPQSQPAGSSLDEARATSATESTERDFRATVSGPKGSWGMASKGREAFPRVGPSALKPGPLIEVSKELKTTVSGVTAPPHYADSKFLPPSGIVSGATPASVSQSILRQEEKQETRFTDTGVIAHQSAQVPSVQASAAPSSRIEASGINLPEPSQLILQKATKEVQPSIDAPTKRLASERIRQPDIESDPTPASSTPGSLPLRQNFQLAKRVTERVTIARHGDAQLSQEREIAEQTGRSENTDSLKFTPTPVHKMIVDEISTTSNPRGSQNRVTIGRIEVQVNNVSRPVENRARGAVTSSLASDFLEERYLNRFPIKP